MPLEMIKNDSGRQPVEFDTETIALVTDVHKKFCRNLRRSMVYGIVDLTRDMLGKPPDPSELRMHEFWALEGINFRLQKGEVLGLVGENGSGKSTLLRLLSGIFPPDRGEMQIRGKIGALIAIGAGFHPHMTGRENIFLNGTILGMTGEEIREQFDDIVDFAEIGDFLDAPVSTYSSGMRVRLGFSIAAHINPDLMVIDEVLAVGDFRFKQKCAEKINEIRHRTSVILVSHNLREIAMVCTRGIVLHKGKIAFDGKSADACEHYLEIVNRQEKKRRDDRVPDIVSKNGIYGNSYQNKQKIADVSHRWVDRDGNPIQSFTHGSDVFLEFSYRALVDIRQLVIGAPILEDGYRVVTSITTDLDRLDLQVDAGGTVTGRLVFRNMPLNTGRYSTYITVRDGIEYLYRNFCGILKVHHMPVHFGSVTLAHEWEIDIH